MIHNLVFKNYRKSNYQVTKSKIIQYKHVEGFITRKHKSNIKAPLFKSSERLQICFSMPKSSWQFFVQKERSCQKSYTWNMKGHSLMACKSWPRLQLLQIYSTRMETKASNECFQDIYKAIISLLPSSLRTPLQSMVSSLASHTAMSHLSPLVGCLSLSSLCHSPSQIESCVQVNVES